MHWDSRVAFVLCLCSPLRFTAPVQGLDSCAFQQQQQKKFCFRVADFPFRCHSQVCKSIEGKWPTKWSDSLELISTDMWRPQESLLPPHSNPSPGLSQGMLCLIIVFQQEAAAVHKACRTWCRSTALAATLVQKETKVSISTYTFAAMNMYCLENPFLQQSLFCGLLRFLSHTQRMHGHTLPDFAGESFSTWGPRQSTSCWAYRSTGGILATCSILDLSF